MSLSLSADSGSFDSLRVRRCGAGRVYGPENAPDRAEADAYRLGQHPPGPVRGLTGRRRKRQIGNALQDVRLQLRLAGLARLIAKQPLDALLMKRSSQH